VYNSKEDDTPSYISDETVVPVINDTLYCSDFKGIQIVHNFNRTEVKTKIYISEEAVARS